MKKPTLLNFDSNFKKYIIRTVVILLLLLSVFFLLNKSYWYSTKSDLYGGTFKYREDSFIYKKGDEILENELKVPAFRNMEKGVSYSISTILTYDGSNDKSPYCFFFVDHMFCKVYIDGEEIFSYTENDVKKHDLSKSPGNVYVSCPLPDDCKGRELKIEFIPALDANIDYQLPNPVFSDYSTHIQKTFWDELPGNLIAIATMFLGLSCIFYSTIAMSDSNYREGIFIGIFAILFGIYHFTESDFDFYMISNPYHTYVMDYITFTLVPLLLLAFLRERMQKKHQKITLVLILVGIATFILEMILHFTGIMDMREFLPIIHVSYFFYIFTVLILVAFTKHTKRKKAIIWQLIPILIGMLVDVSVYYLHINLDSSDSTFTSIGVIIFLITELIHVWKYSIRIYTESTRSRVYQQMAYIDPMTAIGNRRAYEIEKEKLIKGEKSYNTLTVVSADLNNLKTTNDNLGHAFGDYLIRNAATVLAELCENTGDVFRIGGDEFIAFIYNLNDKKLESRLKLMETHIEEINMTGDAQLDIAVGIKKNAENIEDAIEEADKNMYADKERRKAKLKNSEK